MDSVQSIIHKLKNSPVTFPTKTNIGTPAPGVTAQEFGNGYQHTTILTIDQKAAVTLADLASLADGSLIYTFPAGNLVIQSAYMSALFTNAEHDTEAADIGLGTVVGSGAVSVLGGTATFENIITGQTGAVGTAEVKAAVPNLLIEAADAHTAYLNIAAAWADTAGAALDADLSGTVVFNWNFLI